MSNNSENSAFEVASFEQTMDFAKRTSRGLFLINGAGVISLINIFAVTVSSGNIMPQLIEMLGQVMPYFIGGAVFSIGIVAFSYLAQLNYTHQQNSKGTVWKISAVLCVVISRRGAIFAVDSFRLPY